mgnify:CR=1 FL=1
MTILYDIIFIVYAVFYLPWMFFKGKFHPGLITRLGILPGNLKLDRPIWFHAVSVGEALVIKNLVQKLRAAYPNKRFIFSTVTTTGNKIIRGIALEGEFVFYLPLDISFIVRKTMARINPSLLVVVETEIWPNLIASLYKRNIPILVINGRISDTSFPRYRAVKLLIRPIFNKINLFCVQTANDRERLISLGVLKDKIEITGNMKFDLETAPLKFDASYIRLSDKEQLLVCGSTHPPEEEIILRAYKKLIGEFPHLRLLIAPRHPERASAIESLVKRFGFEPQKISLLKSQSQALHRMVQGNPRRVFVLDTIGQLPSFYSIADIVFVGGSLIKKGGHNILEPALLEKPILFGPHMFNFRSIAELFINNRAAILVHNWQELGEEIRDLLREPSKITALGARARELVLENRGATQRNFQRIEKIAGLSL